MATWADKREKRNFLRGIWGVSGLSPLVSAVLFPPCPRGSFGLLCGVMSPMAEAAAQGGYSRPLHYNNKVAMNRLNRVQAVSNFSYFEKITIKIFHISLAPKLAFFYTVVCGL